LVQEEGVIMQFVAEIAGLSTFMAMHNVRTYLEVGAYSGGLVAHLHAKFRFDKVAAVSLEPIPYLDHPKHKDIQVFVGSSRSQEYIEWRTALGHFDLVFIDGDHSYRGCLGDYHVELEQSHTFLAFHDIFSMWTLEEKTRRARAKGAALFQDVEYNYWSDKLINGKSPLRFPGEIRRLKKAVVRRFARAEQPPSLCGRQRRRS
jgi:predicted O-methyltransferase YrrM